MSTLLTDSALASLQIALQVSDQRLRDEAERVATLRPFRYLAIFTGMLIVAALGLGLWRENLGSFSLAIYASALFANLFWIVYPAGLMRWPLAKISDQQQRQLLARLAPYGQLHALAMTPIQRQLNLYAFQQAVLEEALALYHRASSSD
mgnify:CR=1 FL=1